MGHEELRLRAVLGDVAQLGLPAEDVTELVQANLAGTVLEIVMRLRALTELSKQLDVQTLMALAAAAVRDRDVVATMVEAIEQPRH